MITLSKPIEAKVDIRVRAPIEHVFEAFVDPAVTTQFWFSRGDSKLEQGKRTRWHWDMYGMSDEIRVKALEPNQRILIEWSFPDSYFVEWLFEPHDAQTHVTIKCQGFKGDGDAQLAAALNATGGFSLVLAGLKQWLETGIAPTIVEDKSPDHWTPEWKAKRGA